MGIGADIALTAEAWGAPVAAPAAKSKKKSGSRKKSSSKKTSRNKKSRKGRKSTKKATPKWKPAKQQPPEQPLNDSLTLQVNTAVLRSIPERMNPGGLRVNSVKPDSLHKIVAVGLNENFTYLPVTHEFIDDLSKCVRQALPDSIHDYRVALNVGKKSLAYYITKVDKLPEKYRKNTPFVKKVGAEPSPKGMDGDIVALWHSHGRYFKPGQGTWYWQRPVLFQTIEDIYTMSYILQYVTPMLENAGAYVLLPRERDPNPNEVIVDNDLNPGGELYSQPYYREITGTEPWSTGEYEGFIYDLKDFRDTENPFEVGTYRQAKTTMGGSPSVAAWYADIPADGEYAVYVSYKSLPESAKDAKYTVHYSGGKQEFTVDQTMGGSTWIYLGTFPLQKGYSDTEPVVTLSNKSAIAGKIVTADAVKIGGGMGNIARSDRRSDVYYDPSTPEQGDNQATDGDDEGDDEEDDGDDETTDDDSGDNVDEETAPASAEPQPTRSAPVFRTSGMPRFAEGARYWLQWAGMPESVYSPYHGSNDYKDDYTSRGLWVNYLTGGSRVLPNEPGLKIPIDAVVALHSDAGKRADDSIVGTLGIYYTDGGDNYPDGTARINSRMLTDMLMRQITADIRQTFEPEWKRRSMWDKSYVEARVPEVPTALIELMSHQNFADMQYGLDPAFRFLVGRSIYKAIARFVAERKGREVAIQPLPVSDFAIHRRGKGKFRLTWKPTEDKLEPTAKPTHYIIYERGASVTGFHKIGETKSTSFDIAVKDFDIHSFKVVAANDGGTSFPSEILALRQAEDGSTPLLIVNGFTRVSAPPHFSADGEAGFESREDFGVPYITDISFAGYQNEFRRSAGERFGNSSSDMAGKPVAGNTFDFVADHGRAAADAGFGFISSSAGAVEAGYEKLHDFKAIDLILGKQRTTLQGRGNMGLKFHTFPSKLQKEIADFVKHGGDLLVSGAYVASDLTGMRSNADDRRFAAEVLGIQAVDTTATHDPIIETLKTDRGTNMQALQARYNHQLDSKIYAVERPDILAPADGSDAEILMRFANSDFGAAITHKYGRGKTVTMSVPFETIISPMQKERLLKDILNYFDL